MAIETVDRFSGSPDSDSDFVGNSEKVGYRASFIFDFLKAMASNHDLEHLLNHVVTTLKITTNGMWAGVFICEPRTHSFKVRVCNGNLHNNALRKKLTASFETSSVPFAESVVRQRAPLIYTAAKNKPFLDSQNCAELGISRALILPILTPEQVLGFCVLLDEVETSKYLDEEVQIFSHIVRALATCIELDRMKAEFKRTHTERRTLQEVTSAVLGESDLRKAMELACRGAQQVTGARGSAIMLLDEEGTLRVGYSMGDAAEWPDKMLPDDLVSTPSIIPIEPVLLDNLGDEYAVSEAQLVRSLVVVPLVIHGQGIGVLQLVNLENSIQEDQLRAISLFADRVALSIEHVKLHRKHERAAIIEERQRLARDLHDSVTQSVYGMTVFAEAAARLLEMDKIDQAVDSLRELRDTSLIALREMRALIFELHPPEVAKMGLVAALQARLAAVESRSGLQTELLSKGVERLPKRIEEGLYRIAQEALNNSIKHSQATSITLHLHQTEDMVSMELADDGVGFKVKGRWSEGGLGIRNMYDRADSIGGSLHIESQPGKRTLIIIEVPLKEGEDA